MKTKRSHFALFAAFVLLNSCSTRNNNYKISKITRQHKSNVAPEFKTYSALNLESNFESNAVQASFFGDYHNALDQAAKSESIPTSPFKSFKLATSENEAQMLKEIQAGMKNPEITAEDKVVFQEMLNLISAQPAKEVFAEAKPVSALTYIVEKARAHHFTLINEAHYNSQHRAFTKELLMPLWEQGYRYLALEALGYQDKDLLKRGYPILSTGYYLKDTNFGNLVREALQIGYKLVAYETQNNHGGTLRDKDQAANIYEQTWKKDQKGKVLVHAGYGHISEIGDSHYEPMGFQLKRLLNQEILTIDQVTMVGLNDSAKLHPYYREVSSKFTLAEPTVFLSSKSEAIVDPILKLGTDIQVYHPMTRFEHGRPHWLKNAMHKQIPLSSDFNAFEGALIQALLQSDIEEAVPADQFIIAKGRSLMLPKGSYNLRIINREGDLMATAQLEVD